MQQAIELNKDFADAWLYLHALEHNQSEKILVEKLRSDFLEADPHHGELWQTTAK